jgi:hypothetical protein
LAAAAVPGCAARLRFPAPPPDFPVMVLRTCWPSPFRAG